MHKKVVLLIKENILQKKMLCAESILLDDLREHGVEICIMTDEIDGINALEETDGRNGGDGINKIRQRNTAKKRNRTDSNQNIKNALYITDSESIFHTLRQQGKYVLPYRHEQNKDAAFAGALYVIEQIEEVDFDTVDMAYRRLACLPWDILETKRCKIRETIVEDVSSFYQIYAEPEITEYMENLYTDRDEEIAYIEEYRKKVYEFYGYGMWTVLTKDGTIIGRAGISWREGFEVPELGFVIGTPWQRQGYAYEVCSAILDYARDELGFAQVQALVMEGNGKSAALCKKLGFEMAGRMHLEGENYSLYKMQL
ncbi:MAG: GNAT family N-acetyltransferase [Eubacterium sp.]|nr:GNAT family N-acetyltransferase [Eubacterium sp.]